MSASPIRSSDKPNASAAAPRAQTPRWFWIGFALLLLAGLSLRIAYLIDYSDSPMFRAPVGLDVQAYYERAREILDGKWRWDLVTIHGPLYPYILALWLKISGNSLAFAHTAQLLLGTLGAALLPLALRRRMGPAAALVALALWALHLPLIYFEAEFFSESLLVFLVNCALALLLNNATCSPLKAILLGLTLGAAAITHAAALPLVLLLLAYAVGVALHRAWRHGFLVTVTALCGFALPTVPVALHNAALTGSYLIQATGGVNFFIGNNPEADGTANVRPGPEWYTLQCMRFVEGGYTENDLPGPYYYDRAFGYIRAQPLSWLGLIAKKAALAFNAREIIASTPLAAFQPEVALLRVPLLSFGLLLPLALVGLFAAGGWRIPPLWLTIVAVVATQALFVAAGRYRLPMLPAMFALAGLGVVTIIQQARTAAWRGLGRSALLIAAGLLIAFLPIVPADNNNPIEGRYYRGLALQVTAGPEGALRALNELLAEQPNHALALLVRASLLLEQGAPQEAIAQAQRAVAAHPQFSAGHAQLAQMLLRVRGDFAGAVSHYEQALALNPEDTEIRYAYGVALLVWDHHREAAEQFRFVLSRHDDDDAARRGLGLALAELGEDREAVQLLETVAERGEPDPLMLEMMTRLRASSPDDAVFDPQLAMKWGGRLSHLTGLENPRPIDALAMALAAGGNYEAAANVAETAAEVAEATGAMTLRDEILARRQGYLQQQPYRAPAR